MSKMYTAGFGTMVVGVCISSIPDSSLFRLVSVFTKSMIPL